MSVYQVCLIPDDSVKGGSLLTSSHGGWYILLALLAELLLSLSSSREDRGTRRRLQGKQID